MPMLDNDWSHIHIHSGMTPEQKESMGAVLTAFRQDLKNLTAVISGRNTDGSRPKRFESFNPVWLECSVSV